MGLFANISRPNFAIAGRALAAHTTAPFKGKALRRRRLMFKAAEELLPHLPRQEGESVHAIMSGRYDLMVLVAALLPHYSDTVRSLRVATLSFNVRNVCEFNHLLTTGRAESITLLCSAFYRANNRAEYAAARSEAAMFPGRWRVAAARSHAKVICADFGERRIVLEGSANLRTNSNQEQLAVIVDVELHDWYAAWIDELVNKHERDEPDPEAEGEADPGE